MTEYPKHISAHARRENSIVPRTGFKFFFRFNSAWTVEKERNRGAGRGWVSQNWDQVGTGRIR